MCMIVDANSVSNTFASEPDEDFLPIHEELFAKRGLLVLGGQLRVEYLKVTVVRSRLRELDRAGRLRLISDDAVAKRTGELKKQASCKSDDHHIIALAQVSGARLLCSHDKALHEDFKNGDLLKPRGSIYQNRTHAHLLAQHCTQCG